MFLSIKEMERRPLRFAETFQPGQIDFSGENLEQTSLLKSEGSAELLEDSEGEVRIQCKYSVELGWQCDRCLGQARFPLSGDLDLSYRPSSVLTPEEEVEIDEGEAEIGFYDHGGLELADVLREQILLALPMKRVCKEDCKGICPVCGKNGNEAACGCNTDSGGGVWEALRQLGEQPGAQSIPGKSR